MISTICRLELSGDEDTVAERTILTARNRYLSASGRKRNGGTEKKSKSACNSTIGAN